MTVVQFKPKEPDVPHVAGMAKCLDCRHEWSAVMPFEQKTSEASLAWLECPSCHLNKGRFMERFDRDVLRWNCTCGNDLFFVSPDGCFCPNCGDKQTF